MLEVFSIFFYSISRYFINYFYDQTFAQQADPFQTSLAEWLDIVWSLAVLDALRPRQAESVLGPEFTEKLTGSYLRLKLLIRL